MNHDSSDTTVHDRRDQARAVHEGDVAVEFVPQTLVGPGQNISDEGVFFVADGALTVRVDVGDGTQREAEIVRVQSMGEGRVGVAVRFRGGS